MDDSIRLEIRYCAGQSGKGFAPLADSYDLWLDPGMTDVACGVRTVEALRCSADAVLPREHADQPCCQRRRVLSTSETGADSGSAFLLAGLRG